MGWQVQPPPTVLAVVPGLTVPTAAVQVATPVAGNSPQTATFPANITPGNSVVVAFYSSTATAPTVAPTSGGDTFTQDSSTVTLTPAHTYFYHVSGSAGGYNGVKVTIASSVLAVYAWEVLGLTVFDNTTSNSSGAGSWSTNLTPATSAEFLAGIANTNTNSTLSTAPAAPWINQAVVGSTTVLTAVGSYQFVSSTSSVNYSGTFTGNIPDSFGLIGAYKLRNPGLATPVNQCILYYFGGQLFAMGTSGNPVLLATT